MLIRSLNPEKNRFSASARTEIDGTPLAVDLHEGRLHAIGGWLPASVATSWLPRNAEGWYPAACYVLSSGSQAVLVDTGLAAHGSCVEAGLESLLGAQTGLEVLLTRREPDTLMNLPWIARRYQVRSVRCSGPVDPFDYVERMEEAMTAQQMREMVCVPVKFLAPASRLRLGEFQLELIKPAIRVLATDWLYESGTATLFSSDMWAFVSADAPEQPVCRVADERIGVDRIVDHLLAKFDWLEGIDTEPIAEQLGRDLAGKRIERICPNYGCIVEGRDVVAELVANTMQALARLHG